MRFRVLLECDGPHPLDLAAVKAADDVARRQVAAR
jgi:hypothetical protein